VNIYQGMDSDCPTMYKLDRLFIVANDVIMMSHLLRDFNL